MSDRTEHPFSNDQRDTNLDADSRREESPAMVKDLGSANTQSTDSGQEPLDVRVVVGVTDWPKDKSLEISCVIKVGSIMIAGGDSLQEKPPNTKTRAQKKEDVDAGGAKSGNEARLALNSLCNFITLQSLTSELFALLLVVLLEKKSHGDDERFDIPLSKLLAIPGLNPKKIREGDKAGRIHALKTTLNGRNIRATDEPPRDTGTAQPALTLWRPSESDSLIRVRTDRPINLQFELHVRSSGDGQSPADSPYTVIEDHTHSNWQRILESNITSIRPAAYILSGRFGVPGWVDTEQCTRDVKNALEMKGMVELELTTLARRDPPPDEAHNILKLIGILVATNLLLWGGASALPLMLSWNYEGQTDGSKNPDTIKIGGGREARSNPGTEYAVSYGKRHTLIRVRSGGFESTSLLPELVTSWSRPILTLVPTRRLELNEAAWQNTTMTGIFTKSARFYMDTGLFPCVCQCRTDAEQNTQCKPDPVWARECEANAANANAEEVRKLWILRLVLMEGSLSVGPARHLAELEEIDQKDGFSFDPRNTTAFPLVERRCKSPTTAKQQMCPQRSCGSWETIEIGGAEELEAPQVVLVVGDHLPTRVPKELHEQAMEDPVGTLNTLAKMSSEEACSGVGPDGVDGGATDAGDGGDGGATDAGDGGDGGATDAGDGGDGGATDAGDGGGGSQPINRSATVIAPHNLDSLTVKCDVTIHGVPQTKTIPCTPHLNNFTCSWQGSEPLSCTATCEFRNVNGGKKSEGVILRNGGKVKLGCKPDAL